MALAGRRRVRVARGGRRRCAGSAWTPATLAPVARPIPAMRVETPGGDVVPPDLRRDGDEPAVGFDRSRLDPALLDLAARGRRRRPDAGATVATVDLDGRPAPRPRDADGALRAVAAPVDRRRRRAALGRGQGRGRRPAGAPAAADRPDLPPRRTRTGRPRRDARMRVLRRRLRRDRAGARRAGQRRDRPRPIVATARWPATARARSRGPWSSCDPGDRRRSRRLADGARRSTRSPVPGRSATGSPGGPVAGWLLVGDAAGFLDPFTGEGLHRAFVSAELGGRGRSRVAARRGRAAFAAYDRAMRAPVPGQGRASRGSSRRSWRGRRCSTTRPGGSRRATPSVRRWAS